MRWVLMSAIVLTTMSFAWAFSETVTIAFTEPSQKIDGKPITDLSHTTIRVWYLQPDGIEIPQLPIVIPASSPSGGGDIEYQATLGNIDPYKWVKLQAIASTSNPDRPDSEPSNTFIYTFDREPPKSPR